MKQFKYFLLVAIMGASFQAKAAFLVEPYMGYVVSGDYKFDSSLGILSADVSGGPTFGTRIGYGALGLYFGLDYMMGEVDAKIFGLTDDFKVNEMAVFASYEFPILFRLLGGVIFNSKAKFNDGTSIQKANGFKLGVGYTGLPFVALNLEYKTVEYKEETEAGVNYTLNPKDKINTIMLSVSLPLTF